MKEKNTDVGKFWDVCHNKDVVVSLSGCGYDETIDFLKVRDRIVPGHNVLEVGVGLGYVTKGLYENKLSVSALDISDVALKRVKNYCESTYLVDDVEKLPSDYFDIIICNNVVQHVRTDLLIKELNNLIRSLKLGGVFSVEFVSSIGLEDNGQAPSYDEIVGGGLCRTPKFLAGLIETAGGKCTLVFDKKVDIGIVKGHHVFHVRKVVI